MRVAVLGPLCQDTIIHDENKTYQVGGVTYYTGNALASLGADVCAHVTTALSEQDVCDALICEYSIIPSKQTIEFVNQYETDADVRLQFVRNAAGNVFTSDVDFSSYDAAVLGPLYHDNFSEQVLAKLSDQTRIFAAIQGFIRYEQDGRIVWKHPENVFSIAQYIEVLFCDEKELAFVTATQSVETGAQKLLDAGVQTVCVTRGSLGSTIVTGNSVVQIPAFAPEKLVDATGAGDSYMAGYVYACSLFDSESDKGCFAAMVATRSLEQFGPAKVDSDTILKARKV